MEPILSPLAHLGIAGCLAAALVLFAWHMLTKTIPRLVKAFKEEQAEDRKMFKAELAAEREQCHKDHEKMDQKQDALARQVSDNHEQVMREIYRQK